MRLRHRAALLGLLITVSGIGSAQTPTTVTNSDVRNSIVTGPVSGRIEQNNYYQSPDPVDRRFSSTISLFLSERYRAESSAGPSGAHQIVYDPEDSGFRVAGKTGSTFLIFVTSDDDTLDIFTGSGSPRCRTGSDIVAGGLAYSVDQATVGLTPAKIQVSQLREDNAVLKAICASANLRAESGEPESGVSDFDLASDPGGNFAVIELSPGSTGGMPIEEQFLSRFWFGFDVGLDGVGPSAVERLFGRDKVGRNDAELQTRGSVDIDVEPAMLVGFNSFSSRALKAYGKRLDALQTGWLDFVARSSVRINGRDQKVMSQGHVNHILPRSRLSDLSQPGFWRSFRQSSDFYSGVSCLAATYAVDKGLAQPAEVPFFRSC